MGSIANIQIIWTFSNKFQLNRNNNKEREDDDARLMPTYGIKVTSKAENLHFKKMSYIFNNKYFY